MALDFIRQPFQDVARGLNGVLLLCRGTADPLDSQAQGVPDTQSIIGAEGFSFMLQVRPGAYIIIGNGIDSEGGCNSVHTPLDDVNDDILVLGAAYSPGVVQAELGGNA